MMSSKEFLAAQLSGTAKVIEWAISQVPQGRLLEAPPHGDHPKSAHGFKTYFGQWSAYRLLFHLVNYEENYALPTMRYWLGESHPNGDLMIPDSEEEQEAWARELEAGAELSALLARFRVLRDEQVEVLRNIPDEEWAIEKLETEFGPVSAEFAVVKTIQHTLEHGNDILKNALYWDRALEWLDSRP